jgi:hypothetical protein
VEYRQYKNEVWIDRIKKLNDTQAKSQKDFVIYHLMSSRGISWIRTWLKENLKRKK